MGLPNIKINTVARKELSEATIVELAEIAKKETVHLRFIEMMPIGLGKEHPGKQQEEVEDILTNIMERYNHTKNHWAMALLVITP